MAPATTKKDDDDDDNEEEQDDDYNPDEEMQEDDDEADNAGMIENTASATTLLSMSKRKAVDEAFERLFGYKYGTRFQPKRRKLVGGSTASLVETLLCDLFGATAAAQILQTPLLGAEKKRAPMPPLRKIQMVKEVKKYAGRAIVVERKTTMSTSSIEAPAAASVKPMAGLDNLLEQLSGPGKLTTVAKTSSDWDSFKTKEGVNEELESHAQGKQAFLQKKDFLSRVDQRRFEQEKTEREAERSKRGK